MQKALNKEGGINLKGNGLMARSAAGILHLAQSTGQKLGLIKPYLQQRIG